MNFQEFVDQNSHIEFSFYCRDQVLLDVAYGGKMLVESSKATSTRYAALKKQFETHKGKSGENAYMCEFLCKIENSRTSEVYYFPFSCGLLCDGAMLGKLDFAEVLTSLQSDCSVGEGSWNDHRSDFGEDASFETYKACSEVASNLRRVLGRGTFQELNACEEE